MLWGETGGNASLPHALTDLAAPSPPSMVPDRATPKSVSSGAGTVDTTKKSRTVGLYRFARRSLLFGLTSLLVEVPSPSFVAFDRYTQGIAVHHMR